MEDLRWTDLTELGAAHGDGFWLLDLPRFRANLRGFLGAFAEAGWPDVTAGWSFKTNWAPPIVRAAVAEGARPEVVSRHEYDLALAMGFEPSSIVYNGPLKTRADLSRALGQGALVHLDGTDEADDLLALAAAHPDRSFRVGLRANIDIGLPDRGRFGIDAESGELQRVFRSLTVRPNIRVVGLHVHISGARKADQYRLRAERLIALSDELWAEGDGPETIDLGGGFAGKVPAALAQQMASPPPTSQDYAAAIVGALRRRWPTGGPRLVVEPGMGIVADAMKFAARVGATKTVAGVRHAIVAASVYTVKPTLHQLDMPFQVLREDGAEPPFGPTVVSGWTCMEIDVLSRGNPLRLERGDWLVFDNCGAYTFVLNPRFIRGTPALLARHTSGGPFVAARPADTVGDWLHAWQESIGDAP